MLVLMAHTLWVAVPATLLCGIVGVATAWFVERTNIPGRRLWALLMVVPLAIPSFVTSYSWASISPSMQGIGGAIMVTSATYYPIVFLLVAASLRGMDPALEEHARSLGCTTWQTFRRIVLPQMRPALLGGMLLVSLDLLVELDAFVALKVQTFSTAIYAQYESGLTSGVAALSCVTVVFCIVFLFVESKMRGPANYTSVSHGARRAAMRYRLGRATPVVVTAFTALVVIAVGVPVGTLGYWFSQTTRRGLSEAAGNIRYLPQATVTSVGLGIGAAIVALLLSLPLALAITRHRGRTVTLLERASYLSYALPDLVGGLALAYVSVHYASALYESVVLLILAYAILFIPLAVVAMRATLGQIEPRLEDSARSLGLSRLRVLWRVTLPLARPGVAAAGVLVFAFVIGDLSTTQVLLPPGMYTLATQFSSNSAAVAFSAAAPYAAVLIVLAVISTYVIMSRYGRTRMADRT